MGPNEGESSPQRHTSGDISVAILVQSLSSQLDLLTGSAETIRSLCARIGKILDHPPSEDDLGQIQILAHALRTTTGARIEPVADLLDAVVATCPAPWTLLSEMLFAQDGKIARQALELASAQAASGAMPVNRTVVELFACVGSVLIIVPPDIHVDMNGFGLMGSFDSLRRTADVADVPVLRVRGFALMGSATVKVRGLGEPDEDA